jgi:VRR-NUC domain-containing protein
MKVLEKEIQLAICKYLELKKYFFWRQNNVPIFDPGKGGGFRSMPKYSMKGIPDIIVIKQDGKVCFLECKTPTNTQSESQKIFQKKCEEKNAEYFVVTSLDDVQAIGL